MKHDILIVNGDLESMHKALDENKVVLAAVELGDAAQKSIDAGFSDHFNANVKLKQELKDAICFCKKPGTHLVYFWRENKAE